MELTITTVTLLILIPLLIWRIYSRLRQLFARQQSVMWKHWTGAVGLPLILLAAANAMRSDVLAVSLMGSAALGGGWLAVYALKRTRFENAGLKLYFTPYARIGIVLCMLFAARVIQIGVELYLNRQSETPRVIPQAEVMQHPFTVVSFGLMLGYLAWYSYGLLRWRLAQKPLPEQE